MHARHHLSSITIFMISMMVRNAVKRKLSTTNIAQGSQDALTMYLQRNRHLSTKSTLVKSAMLNNRATED